MRVRPPYAVLAAHYDEVYEIWRTSLSVARDEIFRSRRVGFRSVLDLGCGSGWQSLELARRGAAVVAIDPVRSFLAPLRAQARKEKLALEVRLGSLPSPPIHDGERFDLVLATFDVLNHLTKRGELLPAFREVHRTLVPGGHFFYDLNTPETLELFDDHHRVVRLEGDVLSAETGSYDGATRIGTVRRDWFFPLRGGRGRFRRLVEEYRETAWSREEVDQALRAAGLTTKLLTDSAGWLSFSPPGARWIGLAARGR